MSSKYFYFLSFLVSALLACSTSSQLSSNKSDEIIKSIEAARFCFKECNSALPKGWYIQRLKVAYGDRPITCNDKIEALQAEIDDLQMELNKLLTDCSD